MLAGNIGAFCKRGRERNGDGEEVGFREMGEGCLDWGRGNVTLDNK